jgi:hypothetical protein
MTGIRTACNATHTHARNPLRFNRLGEALQRVEAGYFRDISGVLRTAAKTMRRCFLECVEAPIAPSELSGGTYLPLEGRSKSLISGGGGFREGGSPFLQISTVTHRRTPHPKMRCIFDLPSRGRWMLRRGPRGSANRPISAQPPHESILRFYNSRRVVGHKTHIR